MTGPGVSRIKMLEELEHFAVGPLAERDAHGQGGWAFRQDVGDLDALGLHGDLAAGVAGAVERRFSVRGSEGKVQEQRGRLIRGRGLLGAFEKLNMTAIADVEQCGALGRFVPLRRGRAADHLGVKMHRPIEVAHANSDVVKAGVQTLVW